MKKEEKSSSKLAAKRDAASEKVNELKKKIESISSLRMSILLLKLKRMSLKLQGVISRKLWIL